MGNCISFISYKLISHSLHGKILLRQASKKNQGGNYFLERFCAFIWLLCLSVMAFICWSNSQLMFLSRMQVLEIQDNLQHYRNFSL